MLRIALVNAPLISAVCDRGVGHQMPLGLLMLGGPLIDAGHAVCLIDGAREHLGAGEIARRVARSGAQVVMIAHVGSTPAHTTCLRVLRAIKQARPRIVTVYGGVHPTYHHRAILTAHPEVDVIVRGEGEETVVDLAESLARQLADGDFCPLALAAVRGIAWRHQGEPAMTSARPPIQDLDAYRIGWELIADWDRYQAFGRGRAAVVQFSRGCPHTCTYCGQWMFWKRWRHRDVTHFVDELAWLHLARGVNFFWLADENPTTEKETWRCVLEEIVRRALPITICASIRARDLARDADILHLYKQAGFLYILMGIETVSDAALAAIRKGSSVDDGYQAIRLLRQHGIMSIVDYIVGIDEETPRSLWHGLRGLWRYDGDLVNALYMTPHAWTPFGREVPRSALIEPDLHKWDYRHQVIAVKRLSPSQLFVGVKLLELCYHLHPRRLLHLLAAPDPDVRRQLRFSFLHTSSVFSYEVYEHLARRWRHAAPRSTVDVPTSSRPSLAASPVYPGSDIG